MERYHGSSIAPIDSYPTRSNPLDGTQQSTTNVVVCRTVLQPKYAYLIDRVANKTTEPDPAKKTQSALIVKNDYSKVKVTEFLKEHSSQQDKQNQYECESISNHTNHSKVPLKGIRPNWGSTNYCHRFRNDIVIQEEPCEESDSEIVEKSFNRNLREEGWLPHGLPLRLTHQIIKQSDRNQNHLKWLFSTLKKLKAQTRMNTIC